MGTPILVTGAAGRVDGIGATVTDLLLKEGKRVSRAMADLHCAGHYDRMSDDVFTLTGQAPMSVQEFVGKNAAAFTASAKAA